MDFFRRLFRGRSEQDASRASVEPGPESQPMADQRETTTIDHIKWHRAASESRQSAYSGEIDGAYVAAVTKNGSGASPDEPWTWQLQVPTDGVRRGRSRILRDAKAAAEQALGARVT